MSEVYTGTNIIKLDATKVLNQNNGTARVNLFQLTGSACIHKLYGQLTAKTTLANMTAVYFTLYDSTLNTAITKNDGVMSTAIVGATILKHTIASVTAGINLAVTGTIVEQGIETFSAFVATQKNGANTFIAFNYTTTDAPIACTFKFFAEYESLNGGLLVAV